jgi:hypothetical protein
LPPRGRDKLRVVTKRAWLFALCAVGCAHTAGAIPDQLDKPALIRGMQPARESAHACYERFKVPGRVDVGVNIAPDGHVTAAKPTGQFSNTPTGDCVAAAVKSTATFSPFKGPEMRIRWPIILQ